MPKLVALLLLVPLAAALAACGGSGSTSSGTSSTHSGSPGAAFTAAPTKTVGGKGQTIDVEASPSGELAYTTKNITAQPGEVTVDFKNPQELSHDVAVEDSSGKVIGKTELVLSGSTSTTVKLSPGTYHFFCTVPGHRAAGMEGTLTVK
jgi:plastocyanin